MKTLLILPLLLLSFLVIPLVHAEPARYWFQVGVSTLDPEARFVLGASVEINVRSENPSYDGALAYWVGFSLPADYFIQTGYMIWNGGPRTFWTYYNPATEEYVTTVGTDLLSNGWTQFSITMKNGMWRSFMNQQQLGEVRIPPNNSGGNSPWVMAEDAGTTVATDQLGPVEFRNMQYQTSNGTWRPVQAATAYIGYGAGSTHLSDGEQYPYGVNFQPGRDNYWIAGSLSSSVKDKQILWPWHQVQVNSAAGIITDPSGWYTYNTTTITIVVPSIRETGRGLLVFWYWSVSGRNTLLSAATGLNQTAQFKLDSSITVSAIYRLRNFC